MIRRSLWALIHPFQAAALIPGSEPLSYRRLIPTLMLGGLFFIVLHTRFVLGHWVWELGYWPLILLQFMLVGVWVWLIGVLVLVVTFWLFAPRRPTLSQVEIGVVYLWMSFCIMPMLDVVHLFGVPTVSLTERLHWQHFLLAHFSLLLTSPVRMILVYCLLRALGEVPRGRAWLLAFVLSFGARFVIEPSGGLIFSWTSRFGITPHFWIGQFVLVVATLVLLLLWRWWWQTRSWPRTLAAVTPITAVLVLLSVGVWQLSWSASLPGNRPAPFELPPVRLLVLPVHLTGQGPRWERTYGSTDASLAVAGDFLDGLNHQVSLVMPLAEISGNVLERLRHLECQAQVVARDGRPRDGSPWVRCDLVDAASNIRLAGVPMENVTGTFTYSTQWQTLGPVGDGLMKAVMAGTVHAELVVGVRGGGDYTDPDRLEIVAVAVSGGPSSQVKKPGWASGVQQFLHDDRVDPAAVEPALLIVDADGAEPEPGVEGHAGRVRREGRQHELVVAVLTSEVDEPRQQDRAHALAAPCAPNVD